LCRSFCSAIHTLVEVDTFVRRPSNITFGGFPFVMRGAWLLISSESIVLPDTKADRIGFVLVG
jgi:hypothetical protein